MILHTVTFTLKEKPTDRNLNTLSAALAELPTQIPEMKNLRHGRDLGEHSNNADYGLVAEFDSPAAFNRFLDHPAHLAVAHNVVAPLCAQWSTTQFHV